MDNIRYLRHTITLLTPQDFLVLTSDDPRLHRAEATSAFLPANTQAPAVSTDYSGQSSKHSIAPDIR
jgi:hypothetical protein